MRRPVAIDLFAGGGGMSLGLEAAGFDVAAAVEFDAVHALVHHYNFPYSATICKDISKLDTQDLLNAVRDKGFSTDIDLIAGGPPCQGFSQIGKRQLDDPRNSLVFEYVRIIREIKPKYFIFENVPGIASGKHKQFLNELINELQGCGYSLSTPASILDASVFGAPQKRKRMILLGSRQDVPKADYPECTHTASTIKDLLSSNLSPLNTVGDAIGDLAGIHAYIGEDRGIPQEDLSYQGFRHNFGFEPSGLYSLCHKRSVPRIVYGHIGSKHTEKSIEKFSATEPGTTEKTSRFFKLAENGLCNTLRAGTASDKGAYTAARPIHYLSPRCITVREAARLHSFPDWYQFHTTIWHGFREIGNAVIPMFAKAIADEIIRKLDIDPRQLSTMDLFEQDRAYLSYNMSQACGYWEIEDDVIAKRKRLPSKEIAA
ncbi:DNA cytosine methyltransferase [Vibrio navarrensis]|uniref:DNA cytosine methyltransferase n=1 Tax=Vibrio navarrensis TaxID=29495 RepID=UPI0018697057|nr:DNA cytosine methyltransferase [Vibrio navarrensis]MBE4590653.1 DNA (cytosine-5-)-methyltransferase [Vibrio navarrensis]